MVIQNTEITLAKQWLHKALGLSADEHPFPWQLRLLRMLRRGQLPDALDIPTGLGKTSVMATWLVARALGAKLPRRLVYVVDRRAVVDQATLEAERLREFVDRHDEIREKLGLGSRSLPVSTLRGQHVDNREWQDDPSAPAIIVGTVDMVGSRLFFQGYGVSRRMRPYHAALLGVDSLIVLDEAHLVPPFERLLDTVIRDYEQFGPTYPEARQILPRTALMSLSATGRQNHTHTFRLDDEDRADAIVAKRLGARKRLRFITIADERNLVNDLVGAAWELTDNGTRNVRCIVFVNSREHALKCAEEIQRRARGDRRAGTKAVNIATELLVGGRRVFERQRLQERLEEVGFLAGRSAKPKVASFLFATSAGEVGVDLDADCAVFDLVAWERMVQRLGRVNRRGETEAEIVIVAPTLELPATEPRNERERKRREFTQRLRSTERLLRFLSEVDGAFDGSPGALQQLVHRSTTDEEVRGLLESGSTPEPLRPAITRAHVDAWAFTSLREHPGRSDIGPWLRGWLEDDQPQTRIVWRTHLPKRRTATASGGAASYKRQVEAFFEAAPLQASEVLETETYRAVDWLMERAKRLLHRYHDEESGEEADSNRLIAPDEHIAIILEDAGHVSELLRLDDLRSVRGAKERLHRLLAQQTVILDARVGGLTEGILAPAINDAPATIDDEVPWGQLQENASATVEPAVTFRVRLVASDDEYVVRSNWLDRFRFAVAFTADGEPNQWLIVEKWRDDAAGEDDRSAQTLQLLEDHQSVVARNAVMIAKRLGLPHDFQRVLELAGRLHDEGKRAWRWQRAFRAPKGTTAYAKAPGPIRYSILDGYRHELGSLLASEEDVEVVAMPALMQDLLLHVIVAHHGYGRPFVETRNCMDAPPSALEATQEQVAHRFADLQWQWGPWGLAWLEALLRSADFQASKEVSLDGPSFEEAPREAG